MPSIGLGMIAKNAEETIERAINPFIGQVDQISICLGGQSEDKTPQIARSLADVVTEFEGEFHFGLARQQAYDQLTTDWAITVDADEIWTGAEHLKTVIEAAGEDVAVIVVKITSGDWYHEWTQSRMHRRGVGRWTGQIHEYWKADKGYKAIFTNNMSIHQPAKRGPGRMNQNIDLAYRWLEDHPDDLRTLAHLTRDLTAMNRFDEMKGVSMDYLKIFEEIDEDRRDYDQHFGVLFNLGAVQLETATDEAMETSLLALESMEYGAGWTLLGENFQRRAQKAKNPVAMARLAIFCAEQAIAAGKTRSSRGYSKNISSVTPFMIKAHAYERLGQIKKAIQALDMVLWLEPGHGEAKSFRETLCRKVGMVP